MTDDPGVPDETDDANEDETSRDEDAWTNCGPAFRPSTPLPRSSGYLASIYVSAIHAAQRAFEQGHIQANR